MPIAPNHYTNLEPGATHVQNLAFMDFTKDVADLCIIKQECPQPGCNGESEHMSYGSVDVDQGQCIQHAECGMCGANWEEVYEFTGIRNPQQPSDQNVVYRRYANEILHTSFRIWKVTPLDFGHFFIPMIQARFQYLEHKGWIPKMRREQIGNVKLIQHAAEMYDLLQEAHESMSGLMGDHPVVTAIETLTSKIKSLVPDGV